MEALLALILGALCPIWHAPTPTPTIAPSIVTVSEDFHEPFDVSPPTRLDVLLGGDPSTMNDRCNDMGGVLVDLGRCADVDY